MEINGASPSAYKTAYDRPIAISNSTEGGDGNINVYVVMPDTVDISPEAAARAYSDTGSDEGSGSDDTDVEQATDKPAASDAEATSATEDADASKSADDTKGPSTPKAFVYGALGLERPEETQGKKSDGYDFGRWLSAGVTIGTIISILV